MESIVVKMREKQTLIVVAVLATFATCTSTTAPSLPDMEDPAIAAIADPEISSEEEIEYGSFSEEQLYQTIISELDAQRGNLEEAGDNYLDLAMATRDLSIIQRAIQFASVKGDMHAIMQLGLLWSGVEPENAQPH